MKLTVYITPGIGKTTCEDTAFFEQSLHSEQSWKTETQEFRCIGVADGVGGNPGGRYASRYVSSQIIHHDFSEADQNGVTSFFRGLHEQLIGHALLVPGHEKMATTLSCVVAASDGYYLIQAGNTRLWILQGGYLKQLSHDHTVRQFYLDHNDPEKAAICNPNAIYCCFGGGRMELANGLSVTKMPWDALPEVLVLTSDGIHEFVDVDQMETILSQSESDEEAIKAMTAIALENGSRDDKTVMILRQ